MKQSQIIKLSASAVKSYDQCPRKYFYNYIERAPTKQWDHFDVGNLCHKTLEIFHYDYMKNGAKGRSLKKMMSQAFEKAREEFKHMRASLIKESKELIQVYLDRIRKDGIPNVQGVETYFNINISENIIVRGYLDRLDILKDGRYEIIDYKTVKNPKYLDEFQLLVYGIWLNKDKPSISEFKGSYVLLRHDADKKSYDFNKDDVDKAKKKLIQYADTIRNENTWSPIPSILCNWCDFESLCPARQAW